MADVVVGEWKGRERFQVDDDVEFGRKEWKKKYDFFKKQLEPKNVSREDDTFGVYYWTR